MTVTSPGTSRATYREVLAEPRFRLLFATRFLAIAADTLRILALSVLVFAVTGSALLSAVTYGIGFLPQAVGAALFGTLADRVRPRRLIAAGYALEAVTAALLGLAHLPVAASLAVVAGVACLTPVFGGASTRVVAEVLTGDAYVLGRSLSSMSSSAAQLLGLACGGLAVATVGTRHALLVSAGCHLVAALAVRLRLPDLAPPPGTRKGSTLRRSLSNNGRLLADARVRRLLLAQWLPPAFFVGGESLIVAYAAARRFPPGAAGILIACVPVGMLAGDFVVGRFVAPGTRERLVVPLAVVLGLPLVAFAADPPLVLVGALLVLAGTGFAYALGLQRRFLDALPPAARGQAFGLLSAGLMTMQGAGPAAFGFVAQVSSTGVAITLAGAATVVVAFAGRAAPNRAGLSPAADRPAADRPAADPSAATGPGAAEG